MSDTNRDEVVKLQQHLSLLKQEYNKLQQKYAELEHKYGVLSGQTGQPDKEGFVSRLVKTIGDLYDTPLLSDIKIKVGDKEMPGHKLVLIARGVDCWSSESSQDITNLTEISLGPDISEEVGRALLKWVYTDKVVLSKGSGKPNSDTVEFAIRLLAASHKFGLIELKLQCERFLIGSVTTSNSINLYQISEEYSALQMNQYCLEVITNNWNSFTTEDFLPLNANLLFQMFKKRSDFPLHLAIEHRRDDVVFLYLIEYTKELSIRLNEKNNDGIHPLHLALVLRNVNIADTLVSHKCDLELVDEMNTSVLQRALNAGDLFTATYLIDKGARINSVNLKHQSPLHTAAAYKSNSMSNLSGAYKKISNYSKASSLASLAAKMIKLGVDVNAQDELGDTPLHIAIKSNNYEIIDVLLGSPGIDLQSRNSLNETVLWLSLISKAADTKTDDLMIFEPEENVVASKLVNKGCDVNAMSAATEDLLIHLAAQEGLETAALFLLHHGAYTAVFNKQGMAPIHIAAVKGLAKLTSALLEKSSNPNLVTKEAYMSAYPIIHPDQLAKNISSENSLTPCDLFSKAVSCYLEHLKEHTLPSPTSPMRKPYLTNQPFSANVSSHNSVTKTISNSSSKNSTPNKTKDFRKSATLPNKKASITNYGYNPFGHDSSEDSSVKPTTPPLSPPQDAGIHPSVIPHDSSIDPMGINLFPDELEQILASLNQDPSLPQSASPILNKQDSNDLNPFGPSSTSEDDNLSEHTTSISNQYFTPTKAKTEFEFNDDSLNKTSIALPVTRTPSSSYLEERVEYTHKHIIHGRTALHLAITAKQESVIEILLAYQKEHKLSFSSQQPLDINILDSEGNSPIALALWTHQIGEAEKLLQAGSDLQSRHPNTHKSLLLRAIEYENQEACHFLIRTLSLRNLTLLEGDKSLSSTVKHKLAGVVQALVEAGVDVNTPDPRGDCSLWVALRSHQHDIASLLISSNECDKDFWRVDPEQNLHYSILHRAILLKDPDSAVFLVRSGASIDSPISQLSYNEEDNSISSTLIQQVLSPPLHLASTLGLDEVVQMLFEGQANVNSVDALSRTSLHLSIQCNQTICTKLLLSHPALDLSIRDSTGNTPFSTALRTKDHQAANIILTRDPDAANTPDSKGRSYIHLAVEEQDIVMLAFLISVEVDVNMPVKNQLKQTPLMLAIHSQNETVVKHLLMAEANVNLMNSKRMSALHMAVKFNQHNIVEALLEHGANVNIKDENGNNALHIAMESGSLSCASILLGYESCDLNAVNLKGQHYLHVLAAHSPKGRISTNIYTCLIEIAGRKTVPINALDEAGNTALLLAYSNGNTLLCDALIRDGAHPGIANKAGLSIFNVPAPSTKLLFNVLNSVSHEPEWLDGPVCVNFDCSAKFSFSIRKHHCRYCGRLLCAKCLTQQMPIIKFEINKPVKVCEICYSVLSKCSAFNS